MTEWDATFELQIAPGAALMEGTGRFDFTKVWSGDLTGTSRGVMLSAGDPGSGTAGYVALETFIGTVGTAAGACALQQFGTMVGGQQRLTYEVVPGSGSEGLEGLSGRIDLVVDDAGTHRVTLHV